MENLENIKNTKNMKKIYPVIVSLKKQPMFVGIGLMVVVVGLIVVGLIRSLSEDSLPRSSVEKPLSIPTEGKTYDEELNHHKSKIQLKTNPTSTIQGVITSEKDHGSEKRDEPSEDLEELIRIQAEQIKAMQAPISANQIISDVSESKNSRFSSNSSQNTPFPSLNTLNAEDKNSQNEKNEQNEQNEKKAFLQWSKAESEEYLSERLKSPLNRYEIKAGTIIPATLITGIHSDLPGSIIAQVRSKVYDTVSGRYVLIPQGSRLLGLYDSQIAYGQNRVLVVWKRILFPNGKSFFLEGVPGIDLSGYAGFQDQVDHHYVKLFGSVILMSVLSAGAELSQPDDRGNDQQSLSVRQTLAASLGVNIMNTATLLTQKNLGVQPTLVIHPGYRMNVSVTKDMVFPGPYED